MRKRSMFRVAVIGIGPVIFGCVPEEPDTIDTLVVQVPTGATGIGSSPAITTDDNPGVENFTPFGDFDAKGIQSIIPPETFTHNDPGGDGDDSNSDDGGSNFAPLLVSGSTLYTGRVSGNDHQVLEGGYPEIDDATSVVLSVGVNDSGQVVGLSIPGMAGLSAFAIDVTPIGEMVEYSGTSTSLLNMDYVYRVTPRVWNEDAGVFHGEFDVDVHVQAANGFTISGAMTHSVDGSLHGGFVTHSSVTDYDCDLSLSAENILFVAHETFRLSGSLTLED